MPRNFICHKNAYTATKKIIVLGFLLGLLLCVVPGTYAQLTDKEKADTWYNAAVVEYDSGDYRNSSKHITLAMGLYTKIDEGVGRENCMNMILDLKIIAQGYYDTALVMFNEDDYESARLFIYPSREIYQNLQDIQNTAKCELLISIGIDKRLGEIRKKEADALQETGMYLYLDKKPTDYITSILYLDNSTVAYHDTTELYKTANMSAYSAMNNYQSVSDKEGISESELHISDIESALRKVNIKLLINKNMVEQIVEEKETIRINADNNLRNGREAYTRSDWLDVLKYTIKARGLYMAIADTKGISDSKELIKRAENNYWEEIGKKVRLADEYYDIAFERYLLKDYPSAIANATVARNAYSNVLTLSLITLEPEDVTSIEEMRSKYQPSINRCDDLLNNIDLAIFTNKTKEDAEELFREANRLVDVHEYESAHTAATNAKNTFAKIEHYVGTSKCDRLLEDLSKILTKKNEANGYYSQANTYQKVADYENATVYVEKALEIYQDIHLANEIEACNSLVSKITKGTTTKKLADSLYVQAEKYYSDSEYGNGKDKAINAKEKYEEINYVPGVEKSKLLISQCEDAIAQVGSKQWWERIAMIVIILVGVLLIVIKWKLEKRKKEIVERREIEEMDKRHDAEERFKRESGKRAELRRVREMSLERSRLKSILEQEKDKVSIEKTKKTETEDNLRGYDETEPSHKREEGRLAGDPGIRELIKDEHKLLREIPETRENAVDEADAAYKEIKENIRRSNGIEGEKESIGLQGTMEPTPCEEMEQSAGGFDIKELIRKAQERLNMLRAEEREAEEKSRMDELNSEREKIMAELEKEKERLKKDKQ